MASVREILEEAGRVLRDEVTPGTWRYHAGKFHQWISTEPSPDTDDVICVWPQAEKCDSHRWPANARVLKQARLAIEHQIEAVENCETCRDYDHRRIVTTEDKLCDRCKTFLADIKAATGQE